MPEPRFVPWTGHVEYGEAEILLRAQAFNAEMQRRRTIRVFSPRPVARAVIEQCLLAAGSAPSGAHQQPWHFVAVEFVGMRRRIAPLELGIIDTRRAMGVRGASRRSSAWHGSGRGGYQRGPEGGANEYARTRVVASRARRGDAIAGCGRGEGGGAGRARGPREDPAWPRRAAAISSGGQMMARGFQPGVRSGSCSGEFFLGPSREL